MQIPGLHLKSIESEFTEQGLKDPHFNNIPRRLLATLKLQIYCPVLMSWEISTPLDISTPLPPLAWWPPWPQHVVHGPRKNLLSVPRAGQEWGLGMKVQYQLLGKGSLKWAQRTKTLQWRRLELEKQNASWGRSVWPKTRERKSGWIPEIQGNTWLTFAVFFLTCSGWVFMYYQLVLAGTEQIP